MSISRSVMAQLQIVSADIPFALKKLSEYSITLYDVQHLDALTVQAYTLPSVYKEAIEILEHYGIRVTLINPNLPCISGRRFWKRPLLMYGIVGILLLSLFLQKRILFVQVEGNDTIPALLIKETAENAGVKFGCQASNIRSEKIKNQLLESIPQLQWAGVNTNGCVATISVQEKSKITEYEQRDAYITCIVASKAGVVESVTVTSGSSLCAVGQAVTAGQTLISGYTDCGIVIKANRAEGEIYAQTVHNMQAIHPLQYQLRGKMHDKQVRYSLKIGKNLIKFDKGSGISTPTCVKIYEESYMSLPGGFRLPISLIRETIESYETDEITATFNQGVFEKSVEDYLLSQMIVGKVLRSKIITEATDSCAVLSGNYLCSEMIGRTKFEHVLQGEASSD